ncbi:DUF4097 family beta strand repeat-containing protein [Actinomadura rayongensis]|uniref:DUF4097 family beta strand repeat protein n=1 Tax=Actinomadura rayongensis TaxID=1429076 RepID=A0A6I4W8R7_9ACTN|nr:DUF4097 family beta strand repeat-containing protein [Actinomadura rayongensis]MXQ66547.1 DUF4097 family beta strand repeat protein [Actinomadura rayongensis]
MTGRPRRRGRWVALAALTAAVVVVPVGGEVASRALRRTADVPVTFTRPVREVRVDAGDTRAAFSAGPAGRVGIRERLSWTLARPVVRTTWSGDVLWVKVDCGRRTEIVPVLDCGADLDFRVPPGTAVTSTSSSGEVAVRGLTGAVTMRTHSGTLDLAGTSGPVDFEANSGELAATGLLAGRVVARVGSGTVRLAFADAPGSVSARAGSGEVAVTVPPGTHYRVAGGTGSGDRAIDPALPDDRAAGLLDLTTGSGSVTAGYGSGRL